LVAWLEAAGHERIVLLDNASTYPPLLDFYEQTAHSVVRLGCNLGSRALWRHDGLLPSEPFVYSDPDLVPTEECPLNAVDYLWDVLQRHRSYPKAALGLYLDDVPEMPCLAWERSLVAPGKAVEPGCTGRWWTRRSRCTAHPHHSGT
jgi:hypothetical protein